MEWIGVEWASGFLKEKVLFAKEGCRGLQLIECWAIGEIKLGSSVVCLMEHARNVGCGRYIIFGKVK